MNSAPIYYLQGRPSFWENALTGGSPASAAATHPGMFLFTYFLSGNIQNMNPIKQLNNSVFKFAHRANQIFENDKAMYYVKVRYSQKKF